MQKSILYLSKIVASIIMLQTLYYKFSGSEESVFIFSTLGIEPYGRIGIGVLELIASILIFVPTLSWIGALLTIVLMSGAIFSHIFMLGFVVQNDGGYLFSLALIVLLSSFWILWKEKASFIMFLRNIKLM